MSNGEIVIQGVRGSLEGNEDSLVWREPVVLHGNRPCFPTVRQWTQADLRTISHGDLGAFTMFDNARLGGFNQCVVLSCGPLYHNRLEAAGVSLSSLVNLERERGFLVGAVSLHHFSLIQAEVGLAVRGAVWRALLSRRVVEAQSHLRVLARNEWMDRRSYYALATLAAVRGGDPSLQKANLEMAEMELGVDRAEVLKLAYELWQTVPTETMDEVAVDEMSQRVEAMADRLLPIVRVARLTRSGDLQAKAGEISAAVQQAIAQHEPLRIELGGLERQSRLHLPMLAMLAHQLEYADDRLDVYTRSGAGLYGEGSSTAVTTLLARSGLSRVIEDRTARLRRPPLPLGMDAGAPMTSVVANSRNELVIGDVHASVDVVFSRDIMEQAVPVWLRENFKNPHPMFFSNAERTIAELVKNVREHAGLARGQRSLSSLTLSVTRGGGAGSTDRLWVRVSDNGVGVRGSLESRAGVLGEDADIIMNQLLQPAGHEVANRSLRAVTGAGDGLSDLFAISSQLDAATGFPSELFLFSTSIRGVTLESVVARVRPAISHIEIDVVDVGALHPGTLAVVQLPAGSAGRAEPVTPADAADGDFALTA